MTDNNTPETIWVVPLRYKGDDGNRTGTWGDWMIAGADEYTRTDAITPQQQRPSDALQAL